jgi:hypothetical protein
MVHFFSGPRVLQRCHSVGFVLNKVPVLPSMFCLLHAPTSESNIQQFERRDHITPYNITKVNTPELEIDVGLLGKLQSGYTKLVNLFFSLRASRSLNLLLNYCDVCVSHNED